jgi:hypothetical protein
MNSPTSTINFPLLPEREPPYSAFSEPRKRFYLAIVTAAGFFGPLCGAVYLPSLNLYEDVFHAPGTVINATVSVYMAVFAVAVSDHFPGYPAYLTQCPSPAENYTDAVRDSPYSVQHYQTSAAAKQSTSSRSLVS